MAEKKRKKRDKDGNYLFGVVGGSCSGKTFLCNKLINHFSNINILEIKLDSYYFDLIFSGSIAKNFFLMFKLYYILF